MRIVCPEFIVKETLSSASFSELGYFIETFLPVDQLQLSESLHPIVPELDLHSSDFLSLFKVQRPVHDRAFPLQKVEVIAYSLCILQKSLADFE